MITENWYKFASLSVFLAIVFGCVSLYAIQSLQEISQLKTQIQALIDENTKLAAQIKDLSAENQTLQQQNEDNTTALAVSQAEIQRLTDIILTQNAEIAYLNTQLGALRALNQPGLYLRNFLLKLEQQPWLNSVLMTGILIGFPGSCIGFYYLGKPHKQKETSDQPVDPHISEQYAQPENHTNTSRLNLNGHSKLGNKPLITSSLN